MKRKVIIHHHTNPNFTDFPPGENYTLDEGPSSDRSPAVWDHVRVKNELGITVPLLVLIWQNIPLTITASTDVDGEKS